MRRWLAVVVLIVVPVLAQAECAWVLWNEQILWGSGVGLASSWSLIGAFPAYGQCEQSRIAKAKDLLRVTDTDRSGANT